MGTTSDPVRAARALRPTIREARQAIEAARCLTPPVVAGLIEAGLCRLALPRDLGGVEAEPVVALQVYEELAYADASVAWIAWNNQYVCLFSRYSPDTVWHTWFGDVRLLFANCGRATGTAVVVEGGARVSGRWSLVSGCALADWIPLMCVLTDGTAPRLTAAGGPETRMAYVPKGSYTILDTWHSGGLRGTGSHDVVVEDVFVPTERTFSSRNPVALDRPLYRLPFQTTMAAGCAAICLGIAQAAIDTLLDLGGAQVERRPLQNPRAALRERPAVQAMVALSAAEVDAARLLLHDAVGALWAACCQAASGGTDAQRVRVWSSAIHAARTAKAIVTKMYEAAGTSALYVDCPLERAHRDIHVVTQHLVLGHQWLEEAGRVLLGLAPSNPRFFGRDTPLTHGG
jgi:alkylation response protein AidB-like acyl-CoA dehydrogenase